jgi:hypothetical protein
MTPQDISLLELKGTALLLISTSRTWWSTGQETKLYVIRINIRAHPGIEPGTTYTRSKYHTTRPMSLYLLKNQCQVGFFQSLAKVK